METQEFDEPVEGEAIVRVTAAGICHSDAHYHIGVPRLPPLPRTLGHEIAGVVEAIADDDVEIAQGTAVGVHYLISCGSCEYCERGDDQFCLRGSMIGNHVDGGFAEFVRVPARNLVPIPAGIPLEQAAIMMCSSATVYHALKKARLAPGESVAVFGLGGLGQSAVRLAKALGAGDVFGVDLSLSKLAMAEDHGAIPIAAGDTAVDSIEALGGADVALELVGSPKIMRQVIEALNPFGRAMAVGLASGDTAFNSYDDLVVREAEIIGVSDHLRSELPELLALASDGKFDLADVITDTVPLDAGRVTAVLERLASFGGGVRTVISPDA